MPTMPETVNSRIAIRTFAFGLVVSVLAFGTLSCSKGPSPGSDPTQIGTGSDAMSEQRGPDAPSVPGSVSDQDSTWGHGEIDSRTTRRVADAIAKGDRGWHTPTDLY